MWEICYLLHWQLVWGYCIVSHSLIVSQATPFAERGRVWSCCSWQVVAEEHIIVSNIAVLIRCWHLLTTWHNCYSMDPRQRKGVGLSYLNAHMLVISMYCKTWKQGNIWTGKINKSRMCSRKLTLDPLKIKQSRASEGSNQEHFLPWSWSQMFQQVTYKWLCLTYTKEMRRGSDKVFCRH